MTGAKISWSQNFRNGVTQQEDADSEADHGESGDYESPDFEEVGQEPDLDSGSHVGNSPSKRRKHDHAQPVVTDFLKFWLLKISVRGRSGFVRGSFGVRARSVRGPFGVRSGSARDPCRIRSGSVRDPFGFRLDQFRTKIFGAKTFNVQKFSICAAVAAAGGTIRAAGLGMAARRPPPRRRWPHNLKIFAILNCWLRKLWSEIV